MSQTTTTTTTELTESERRTNVLLSELDRPLIPHMAPNASSIVTIPKSPALLRADDGELSEDSDAGSPEKFFGRQPPNIRKFDGSSFADWLTAFIISIGTIPYLSYAFRFDEPVKDARFDERREDMTAAEKRRIDLRFKRRHQYWTQSNATLLAILMEATKDFQPAKQLVSDMIKQRKRAFEILVAIHQTFYPMNEAGKQNAITALFSAASTISDATTPSAWITTLEGLWQRAREAGAVIPNEELPSLLLQGLKRMPNSKIFAEIKMAEQTRAGSKYAWPTAREETLQHEKQAYGEETRARPGLVAQVGKRSCLACGQSDHLMEDCKVLQRAQKWSKEKKPYHSKPKFSKPSGGGKFHRPQCNTCGKFHKGECRLDKRKVSSHDNHSSTNFRRDDDRDDEDNGDSKYNSTNAKGFGLKGSIPYHMRDKSEGNYYQGRGSRGGMSAMIAAAVQSMPTDSFIDSCCDSVYVGRDTAITDAIRIDENVSTAKPDSFIKVIEKGRIDDLPVRKTEEALPRNLIGIGPLCDLGWKLTFEGNTCTITRDGEEIIVPRKGNLYSINISELSRRSQPNHVAFKVFGTAPADKLTLWHHRTMHRSRQDIISWSRDGLIDIKRLDPNVTREIPICPDCAATKSSRASHKRSKSDYSDGSRDSTVSTDIFGPLTTPCCAEYDGCKYIQTFLQIGSRTPTSGFMKQKSEALDNLKNYVAREFVEHYHSDGGAELISAATYEFLSDNNITFSHTNAYTPEQNGHVERIQGTLDGMSNASLHHANLGEEWKCHAWACAIQTFERLPTATDRGYMSPFEYKHGRKPDLDELRTFGCRAWVHIPQEQRRKGEIVNALEGMFVGYGDVQPGWKVYVFKTKQIVTSSDVIFDELTFPGSQALATSLLPDVETDAKNPEDFQYLVGKNYFDPDEKTWFKTTGIRILNDYIVADRTRITGKKLRKGKARSEAPIFVRDVEKMLQSGSVMKLAGRSRAERSSVEKTESAQSVDPRVVQAGGGGKRKSAQSSPEEPDSELDLRGRVRSPSSLSTLSDNSRLPSPKSQQDSEEYVDKDADLPDSIRQALESEDESEEWLEAIRNEVDYLDEHAWIRQTSAPPRRPLNTKLVFKRKFKNGKWKYKVRLVACGYDQREGIDYTESYSPTSRPFSLRLFLYLVLLLNMKIPRHIDVVKAYLNAEIDEETYVKAPSDPRCAIFPEGAVFRLTKALYGLAQSALLWNRLISGFLEENGFARMRNEQCLYYKVDKWHGFNYLTLILVYVDDLVIASQEEELRDKYVHIISRRFNTTDEGPLSEYLGVRIEFDFRDSKRRVRMDQEQYIIKKLHQFGMENCRPASTPLTRGVRFTQLEPLGQLDFPYRQMLGSLIHAMNWTRPDLAFAINMLSRFSANPTRRAIYEIVRVFRYLQRTKSLKLTYSLEPDDHISNFRLYAFSDSDFAGCLDTARSITSFLNYMGPALLKWRSKRQSIVAQHTAEAEYVAANECLGGIMEIENILDEMELMRFDKPVMYVDNQAAIMIAMDPASLQRSRQFRVIYHRLQMAVERRDLYIRKISSHENHADIGTKALDGPDHERHLLGLGLQSSDFDDNTYVGP